eukprot:1181193-Prorocentrum_minimum.AAC.1
MSASTCRRARGHPVVQHPWSLCVRVRTLGRSVCHPWSLCVHVRTLGHSVCVSAGGGGGADPGRPPAPHLEGGRVRGRRLLSDVPPQPAPPPHLRRGTSPPPQPERGPPASVEHSLGAIHYTILYYTILYYSPRL